LAVCFPFGERPTLAQILTGTWATFWPAMLASLMILPAVLWDLTRMSNRFVGPVYRLRNSMRDLADGKPVDPVHFRTGDFWFDFAEDFNRVAATVGATNPTVTVAGESADATNASSDQAEFEPTNDLSDAERQPELATSN